MYPIAVKHEVRVTDQVVLTNIEEHIEIIVLLKTDTCFFKQAKDRRCAKCCFIDLEDISPMSSMYFGTLIRTNKTKLIQQTRIMIWR